MSELEKMTVFRKRLTLGYVGATIWIHRLLAKFSIYRYLYILLYVYIRMLDVQELIAVLTDIYL